MKATITDVAQAAGVSIKTVSRVANNEPGVAKATRENVLRVIQETGYAPDQAARNMRSGRSHSIGMLFSMMPNSFTPHVHIGALQACAQLGFNLVTAPCPDDPADAVDALQKMVSQARVEAVLLSAPFINHHEIYAWLKKHAVPFASVARPAIKTPSNFSFAENEAAAYGLTEHLISLGHKKIALVTGIPNFKASKEREAGFRAACEASDTKLPAKYIADGGFTFEGGMQAGEKLLGLKHRPTAVVCCSDNMAIGVLHAAHQAGIRVPEELSVTGFDDIREAEYAFPPLTTARQPVEDMSRVAVASLINQLKSKKTATSVTGFDCPLVMRGSTAPPPA